MAVRIPTEYQEVEYLESTGNQYIYTDILGKSGIECSANVMWLGGGDVAIFGARKDVSDRIMLIHQYPTNYWTLGYGSSHTNLFNITIGTRYLVEAKAAVGEQFLKIDGETVYEAADATEYVNNFNMAIFACSFSSNNARLRSKARVYSLTVKVDGELAANFIPCYRKSDSEPGMYDTVSKTFYTNSGTGTFLVGDDVSWDTASLLERRRQILLNTPHIESASGSMATFNTDMSAPLMDCKIYFKPIQDLHGYSKPWVGGSGKNLFDKSTEVSGKGINASGTVVDVSTASYSQLIPVTEGQTYTFSATSNYSAQWARRIHFYDQNETWVQQGAVVSEVGDSGIPVGQQYSMSVTIPTDIKYVRISYMGTTSGNSNQDTNPQFELGSTVTTYEPYENICPITGWDGVMVCHGKNILEGLTLNYHGSGSSIYAASDGRIVAYSAIGNACETYIDVSQYRGQTLTLNHRPTGNAGGFAFYSDTSVGEFVSGIVNGGVNTQGEWTITVPTGDNVNYMRFTANPSYIDDVKLILNQESFNIQFPQTIYGGYVDLVKGEVVETWTKVTLDGTETYSTQAENTNYYRKYMWVLPNYVLNSTVSRQGITDYLKTFTASADLYKTGAPCVRFGWGDRYLYIMNMYLVDNGITTVQEFKDYLSAHPLTVAYPISTPNTYPLTPQTIEALKGLNNIWSNANGNIEVKFWTH